MFLHLSEERLETVSNRGLRPVARQRRQFCSGSGHQHDTNFYCVLEKTKHAGLLVQSAPGLKWSRILATMDREWLDALTMTQKSKPTRSQTRARIACPPDRRSRLLACFPV
jgi:hypothetical protein